ncbi:MAG: antitoxin MazE family protein [Bradyrhizobium sp.]
MATTPKKSKPPHAAAAHGFAARAVARAGAAAVQHWVPDLRNPKVLAQIRREAKLIAQHPENDEVDRWIESVYDWESWK